MKYQVGTLFIARKPFKGEYTQLEVIGLRYPQKPKDTQYDIKVNGFSIGFFIYESKLDRDFIIDTSINRIKCKIPGIIYSQN